MEQDNLKVQEYDLQKIDLYDELVNTFKKCLQGEIQNLLKEAREEIYYTQEYIRIMKQENEKIYNDNIEMAKQLNDIIENEK